MKNATNETRIRIFIDMNIASSGNWKENVTMTAGAWNSVAAAYFECATYNKSLGLDSIAGRAKQIAEQIHMMLEMRGYFN